MRIVPVVALGASLALALASCKNAGTHVEESKGKPAEAVAAGEKQEQEEDELDVRDLAAEAKVSLGQALETAMKAYPHGEAVAAELEGDAEGGKRGVAYEVAFVNAAGTEVHVVKVDHVTRQVVASEKEDEADEAQEAMDRLKAAGPNHMRLLDLLHRAMEHGAGAPVAISFGRKRAGVAKATFVKGRDESSVTLDAATGSVVESK